MTGARPDEFPQPACPAAHGDAPVPLFGRGPHGRPGEGGWWKRIVVCGDDFGMNAGIDAGLLRLAGLGRLSAVSCLTQGATFAAHAARLDGADLDLGVHLNLTRALGQPGQPAVMPLFALIARAYAGRLDGAWLDDQLRRQFDAFESVMGRAPDYVDGHQHVHQLPGVLPRLRHAIAALAAQCARRRSAGLPPGLAVGRGCAGLAALGRIRSAGASGTG